MPAVYYSFLSVFIVSICSFVGFFLLALKKDLLLRVVSFLVSFAAGSLIGDAFVHLLPEAGDALGLGYKFFLPVILGIIFFFILEKFIHWRHCHEPVSATHYHPLVFMNLVGDGFHNLIDGVVIAASYGVSLSLGLATTIAIIFHEIPQEIGDLGVLIHAGLDRKKAMFWNFFSAAWAFGGVMLFILIGSLILEAKNMIVPFAAGGFIYIAIADLIPEMHKEAELKKSFLQLVGMILGLAGMLILKLVN